MIFKITFRNDFGIHECIVGAENEFEALIMVKKENPIDGKFDVKEVIEVTGSGILSSRTIKIFKRPGDLSLHPDASYENFNQEKQSDSYKNYVENLKKSIDEL